MAENLTSLPPVITAIKRTLRTDEYGVVQTLDQEVQMTLEDIAAINPLTPPIFVVHLGCTGIQGEDGPKGDTGNTGATGPAGAVIGNSEPSDGSLSANEIKLWFDSTNGSTSLNAKGKSANGTVVKATILMTSTP